jgi:DNA-binding CsgD family transcriptional regulator
MTLDTPLLQILDRMGCGGLVVATDGSVIASNDMARLILRGNVSFDDDELGELESAGRDLIKQLLRQGRTRISLDQGNWILIEREDQRPLIMNAMAANSTPGPDTPSMLVLIDLDAGLKPNQPALEKIFGLTPAEARLATLIAGGATTSEAAQMLSVSLATVRSQLAATFAKTRTRRQAELVTLVSRLSALP